MDEDSPDRPPFEVRQAAIDGIGALGETVRMVLTAGGCGGRAVAVELGEPTASSQGAWIRYGCPGGRVLDPSPDALGHELRAAASPAPADRVPRRSGGDRIGARGRVTLSG